MRLRKFGRLLVLVSIVSLVPGCDSKQAAESQDAASGAPTSEAIAEQEAAVPEEPASETTEMKNPADLSLPEMLAQVNEGKAVLVDVRSDDEWNASHFAQAQHISIDKITEDAAAACSGLNKDKLVLLHCRSGGRAGRAAKILNDLGFNAHAMKMKYDSIKDAGFKEAE